MKQFLRLLALACMTVFFFACNKSSVSAPARSTTSASVSSQQPAGIVKKIISSWDTLTNYYLNIDRNGNTSIMGEHYYDGATQPIYDKSSHTELMYARIPQAGGTYEYRKLIHNMTNRVLIKYTVDTDAFRIYLSNAAYAQLYDSYTQIVSDNWQFRYVVIPKTQFESMSVDWNEYLLVAAALQFTP